jgi:hypothetical protein
VPDADGDRVTATALAAVSWLPADAQASVPAAVPDFFANAAQHLTGHDVVETFPRTSGERVADAWLFRW